MTIKISLIVGCSRRIAIDDERKGGGEGNDGCVWRGNSKEGGKFARTSHK